MAGPRLEGTLAIIKPDAYSRRIEIEEIIMKEGFLLVEKKRMKFTKELAEEFYEDRRDEAAFPQLIRYMTSGDCMVLCLGRENGISHWRSLIGPAKVSCDWWRAGHVTTILPSDWSRCPLRGSLRRSLSAPCSATLLTTPGTRCTARSPRAPRAGR